MGSFFYFYIHIFLYYSYRTIIAEYSRIFGGMSSSTNLLGLDTCTRSYWIVFVRKRRFGSWVEFTAFPPTSGSSTEKERKTAHCPGPKVTSRKVPAKGPDNWLLVVAFDYCFSTREIETIEIKTCLIIYTKTRFWLAVVCELDIFLHARKKYMKSWYYK